MNIDVSIKRINHELMIHEREEKLNHLERNKMLHTLVVQEIKQAANQMNDENLGCFVRKIINHFNSI